MSANCPQCGESWGTHGTACRITGAGMPVGNVVFGPKTILELAQESTPKPPKRVAVFASETQDGYRTIVANDGTVWTRVPNGRKWKRLPDLPQD